MTVEHALEDAASLFPDSELMSMLWSRKFKKTGIPIEPYNNKSALKGSTDGKNDSTLFWAAGYPYIIDPLSILPIRLSLRRSGKTLEFPKIDVSIISSPG
jgi:hypothetical protein